MHTFKTALISAVSYIVIGWSPSLSDIIGAFAFAEGKFIQSPILTVD